MSSWTSYAKTDLRLNVEDQSILADYLKQCEADKETIKDYNKAFKACMARDCKSWGTIGTGLIGMLTLGLVIGFASK